MVGSVDVREDRGGDESLGQCLGDPEIVDAPSDIPLAGTGAVRPPRVGFARVRVEMPEGIDESGLDEFGELAALLVAEPGIVAVLLRSGQVDLFVGHIQIAAEDERFTRLPEVDEVIAEGVVPLHAVIDPLQTVLGVGGVDIDQLEILELGAEDATFRVVALDPDFSAEFQ